MSNTMFYGVLRMPYEMTMENELSRRQFHPAYTERYAQALAYDAAPVSLYRAPLQPVAVPVGSKPIGPAVYPITGLKFLGNIDHPEHGFVATYGGPFDAAIAAKAAS